MRCRAFFLLVFAAALPAFAHVGGHPSIHDTLAGVVDRLLAKHDAAAIKKLEPGDVIAVLTGDDKHVLATEFWSFEVNVPATVSVLLEARQREIPFWLAAEGFEKTEMTAATEDGKERFDVYRKAVPAGRVGLGYPGFDHIRAPYFVVLSPQTPGAALETKQMYPGRHTTGVFTKGAKIYADEDDKLGDVPAALEGHLLVRGVEDRAEETQLLAEFRTTDYAATATPGQIVLTWSADPRTTQTVQWRTDRSVGAGFVQYHPAADAAAVKTVPAEMTVLTDRFLVNDPVNHRFTVTLQGLAPGTEYAYRVATSEAGPWSDPAAFTTAPEGVEPFKFVYMGDAQNGLDTWGKLLAKAHASEPDARFYIMAGDLVNRGIQRDDWDSFFHNAKGVYDRRTLVPCLGNHEDQGDRGPWMYLELFDLPKAGPQNVDPERAYSFTYSNALFVILDSNLEPETQTAWLEQQLAGSDAKWKFVVYHHPAYSSSPKRDNAELRHAWTPLFDKYHVDMALQGHDHAYLRTYPMNAEKRVATPAEGTVYIVSVSGTKFYDQDPRGYTEFGMTNVATYQVLDITIDEHRLVYKAYDLDGNLRDELTIEK